MGTSYSSNMLMPLSGIDAPLPVDGMLYLEQKLLVLNAYRTLKMFCSRSRKCANRSNISRRFAFFVALYSYNPYMEHAIASVHICSADNGLFSVDWLIIYYLYNSSCC